MIGKPVPFLRQCFKCGHSHANNVTCDEARQLRTARFIVDTALVGIGGGVLFLLVLALRALNLGDWL